jgi:uncharacterized Fe-S cluster-containing radical SAM superfamily protein
MFTALEFKFYSSKKVAAKLTKIAKKRGVEAKKTSELE